MKTLVMIFLFFALILADQSVNACTTFIISGKYTEDGKPILFKHRDADVLDNALNVFEDGKYRYIGLVNSNKEWDKMVWGGYNSAGFAIINSAAYNNNTGDTTKLKDQEGVIMKLALMYCKTLRDFENLLDTLRKPLGADANFGVIDAGGGAAYYETGNFRYVKYDVNDPGVAPKGYLVRTNHSFSGTPDAGYGYVRYNTAVASMEEASASHSFTPRYLFNHISRNLTHSLTHTNLMDNMAENRSIPDFRFFIDYIPRVSTSASILIVGATDEKHVNDMVMWTIPGFPFTSVAIPVWLKGGSKLPDIVSMKGNLHSPLCDAALKLKEACFPVIRDRGQNYINIAAVVNRQNTGYIQMLQPVEDTVFIKTNQMMAELDNVPLPENRIQEFYHWLDGYLDKSYQKLFNIKLR